MTTLQDSLEAYPRYRAAGALSWTSTVVAETREAEPEEVPATTDYNIASAESLHVAVADWFRGAEVDAEEVPATTDYNIASAELPHVAVADWFRGAEVDAEVWHKSLITWTPLQIKNLDTGFSLAGSPFDLLDERRENYEKVRELISYVRSSLDVSFARELANRLEFLSEVAKEEGPDQSEVSAESLRMFIKFLELAPDLKCPGVVLSPSGNVRVQWRAAPNKHFVAEFYPDGEVRFVIFRPDPNRPDQTIRLSGTVSVESILSTAEPHGVLEWAGQ